MQGGKFTTLVKILVKEELNHSQKQAVIKLVKKKDKGKRFVQNWRPFSLLNTVVEIVLKVVAQLLKRIFPFLISLNQSCLC